MKAALKYPVFYLDPAEHTVYVFWREENVTTRRQLAEADGWAGQEAVDASGRRYVIRRCREIGPAGLYGRIERAVWHVDSAWVVVRVTIPHRSIRRSECFKAMSVLQVPEGIMELGELTLDSGHFTPDKEDEGVDVATRPGRMQNLYLSWRFAWDERMRTNAFIAVFPSLTDGRHLFRYLPLMLPIFWCDDSKQEFVWPQSAGIPEETRTAVPADTPDRKSAERKSSCRNPVRPRPRAARRRPGCHVRAAAPESDTVCCYLSIEAGRPRAWGGRLRDTAFQQTGAQTVRR